MKYYVNPSLTDLQPGEHSVDFKEAMGSVSDLEMYLNVNLRNGKEFVTMLPNGWFLFREKL